MLDIWSGQSDLKLNFAKRRNDGELKDQKEYYDYIESADLPTKRILGKIMMTITYVVDFVLPFRLSFETLVYNLLFHFEHRKDIA